MAKKKSSESFPVSGPGFRSQAHGVATAREQMRGLENYEPPDDAEELDNRAMKRNKKKR